MSVEPAGSRKLAENISIFSAMSSSRIGTFTVNADTPGPNVMVVTVFS